MPFSNDLLNAIYDKTDGCCHLCHRKLSFTNYGKRNRKGAWHVEHSIPRAKGGTNHLNNLFLACISCNCGKGTTHTRTVRRRNGVSRAPYSRAKKQSIKEANALLGMIGGGIIGRNLGLVGMISCIMLGGVIGNQISPER